MSNVVVVGAQWGDEGKGKIVDWLSERADVIVRFQGGHNAGHTLVINGTEYRLSLLPSGVVRPGKLSVIGNGVVVDPRALIDEIQRLRFAGVDVSPEKLKIADNAVLILPLHQELDVAREKASGKSAIGTTGRGIGPAYEDKAARRAIRVCDLKDPDILEFKANELVQHHNPLRRSFGIASLEASMIISTLGGIKDELLSYAAPVWLELDNARNVGKRILFEGAQGVMLDVDHGTYPFVTSSNTLAGQAATGAGIGIGALNYVLGITKAYTTRVGSGPFPTELNDETGQRIGQKGREFGTVTGRQRRCGWFDAVMVRQAIKTAGINGIALTKLDVLDGLDNLNICTSYKLDGESVDYLPASMRAQSSVLPIYETLEGWQQSTEGARSLDELPAAAIKYIRRIEELIEAPVSLLSTSPERDDTITVIDPFGR